MPIAEQPLELIGPVRNDLGHEERSGGGTPLPRNLIRVPKVRQQTDFSCGTAATLALLRYWRVGQYAEVEEAKLYQQLGTTPARGTEPQAIEAFLNTTAGISAEYRYGDVTVEELERAVDVLEPPIVDLQAWRDHDAPWRDVWDAGHYVIMVGYDHERLFFMDPSRMTPGPYAYLPRAELDERWHDLTGDHNQQVLRMAIFVRGPAAPPSVDEFATSNATKLG
jgi:ABC-type bacteriocin/lantibiotic exporter with double-glycine peptidase domain